MRVLTTRELNQVHGGTTQNTRPENIAERVGSGSIGGSGGGGGNSARIGAITDFMYFLDESDRWKRDSNS